MSLNGLLKIDINTEWNKKKLSRISKALLVGCLTDEIVHEKVTAKEMWTSLEAAYAKKSVAS